MTAALPAPLLAAPLPFAPELLQPRAVDRWRHLPVVLGMAAVHVAAGGWLLQQRPAPTPTEAPAPVAVRFVSLAPPDPPAPPPPPSRAEAPPPKPTVTPPRRRPPLVAAAPTPAAAPPAMLAPPAEPEPPPSVEPAPAPVEAVAAAPAPPAPAPAPAPPAPKTVPASAVQYRQPPAPVYPLLSRRAHETGRVVVRVLVDVQGVPRQLSVQQPSGHARLDDSALAAVRGARFHPYTEDGAAQPVWVLIPIDYELES